MSQEPSQDVPASNPTPGPKPTPAIFGDPKAIQEAKDLIQRTFGHLLIPADPHALLGDICSNCLRPRPDKRKDYCSAHCAKDVSLGLIRMGDRRCLLGNRWKLILGLRAVQHAPSHLHPLRH